MFTVSLKLSKKKLFIFCGILAVILFLTFIAGKGKSGAGYINSAASVRETKALDNAERVKFLNSFGWEVSEEPVEVKKVTIPSEADEVLSQYNEIQKKQGMNLEKYLGERLTRYTYEVKNYPEHKKYVRANIFIYGNRIVAGDISSVELDGFLHGFKRPEDV